MLRSPKRRPWQKTWLTIVVVGSAAIWLWMNIIQQWNALEPVVPIKHVGNTRTFGPDSATLKLGFDETLTLLRPATSSTPFSTQRIERVKHFLEAIDNGVSSRWKNTPVQLEQHHESRVWLALVRGGHPVSRLSPRRMGVADFVSRSGAVAGINGGFFVDASLEGTNNFMIGPVMTEVSDLFQPERNLAILERVQSRPLVIWGRQRLAILPFDSETMNSPELLRAFMPDLKNVFLGGAWIVRHGQAVTESNLEQSGPRDANDVRPRVFFGTTSTSELALGASLTPTSSSNLARAALAAGVREAVLLDSGYSTSLVFDSRIIAVGRKTAKVPSRPVPHAIVVMGTKESTLAQRASSHGSP